MWNPFPSSIISTVLALALASGCAHQGEAVSDAPVAQNIQSLAVKSADGVSLSADCWNCDASKTVVFVHGWSQSRIAWESQVERFAPDHRVVTYDLRGHGASDRPTERSAYDGRWTHAQDLEAVLDAFGVDDCAVVVGWSFGASIAADAAVHLGPDRICGAVFVAGAPDSATERTRSYFGSLLGEIGAMLNGPRGEEEEEAVTKFLRKTYRFGEWDEAFYARVYDVNMSLSPEARGLVVSRPTYRNIDALNEIGVPVLALHGDEDIAILPDAALDTYKQIDNASLKIYRKTGHWPFLEREAEFAADLRHFMKSLDGDVQ